VRRKARAGRIVGAPTPHRDKVIRAERKVRRTSSILSSGIYPRFWLTVNAQENQGIQICFGAMVCRTKNLGLAGSHGQPGEALLKYLLSVTATVADDA
jgi:hypothetical protein